MVTLKSLKKNLVSESEWNKNTYVTYATCFKPKLIVQLERRVSLAKEEMLKSICLNQIKFYAYNQNKEFRPKNRHYILFTATAKNYIQLNPQNQNYEN